MKFNYLTEYHPEKTLSFITKHTFERLKFKYPELSHLPRVGYRLVPGVTSRLQNTLLGTTNLIKSLRYWSYNPLERIGLNLNFLEDLLESVQSQDSKTNAPMVPTGKNPIKVILNKYSYDRDVKVASESAANCNVFHQFDLSLDQQHILLISAQEICPLKLLSAAIFNLGSTSGLPSDPRKLPRMQYFDAQGLELFQHTPASSWGPLIRDVLTNRITYFSCGFLVFQINYIKQMLKTSNVMFFINDSAKLKSCDACHARIASRQVIGSLLTPQSPAYFCDSCYTELYDGSGDDHAMSSFSATS